MKHKHPLWLLALVLTGCALLGGNDDKLTDVETARRLWETQSLHDYDFTLNRSCFCILFGPHRIKVRADTVSSAIRLADGAAVAADELQYFDTIDDLFLVVQHAVREADELQVEYDLVRGYPKRIDIDYYKDAVDDEILYQASDVTPQ